MSGEVSLDRRLSPSGRFVRDYISGANLMIGSGTPGLIWRGQAQGTPVDIGAAAPVAITGMGGAWALPAEYRYDVQVFLTVQGDVAPPGAQNLQIRVEGSTDGGATWTETLLSVDLANVTLASSESRCYTVAQLGLGGPNANEITNVRTRVCKVGAAGDAFLLAGSWTKIVQYIQ